MGSGIDMITNDCFRRGRATRSAFLLSLGCGFVVTACSLSPKHEYQIAPGQSYDASLRSVLLVPINETESLPNELEKGEEAVIGLVREFLQAQGLKVETPDTAKFRRAYSAARDGAQRSAMSLSANTVPEEVGPADLISRIVKYLKSKADLVVVPNMAIRNGELRSKSIRWDGVRRVVPTNAPTRWSGTGSGASLHVEIFKADGTYVFSGYGGLDVLWRANIRASKMELIEDRLENEANLREGVCVAFHPYFGEGESCRGSRRIRRDEDVVYESP